MQPISASVTSSMALKNMTIIIVESTQNLANTATLLKVAHNAVGVCRCWNISSFFLVAGGVRVYWTDADGKRMQSAFIGLVVIVLVWVGFGLVLLQASLQGLHFDAVCRTVWESL